MSINYYMLNRYKRTERLKLGKRFLFVSTLSVVIQTSPGAFGQDSSGAATHRQIASSVVAPPLVASPLPLGLAALRSSSKSTGCARRALRRQAASNYPRSHFEKGLLLKQKHDISKALVEFLKATQENPRLFKSFYEQALIFRERGYKKLAESSLEQALNVAPDFVEARILLATIRLEQGNLGAAVQELSRSLVAAQAKASKESKNNAGVQQAAEPPENPFSSLPAILQTIHDVIEERSALDGKSEDVVASSLHNLKPLGSEQQGQDEAVPALSRAGRASQRKAGSEESSTKIETSVRSESEPPTVQGKKQRKIGLKRKKRKRTSHQTENVEEIKSADEQVTPTNASSSLTLPVESVEHQSSTEHAQQKEEDDHMAASPDGGAAFIVADRPAFSSGILSNLVGAKTRDAEVEIAGGNQTPAPKVNLDTDGWANKLKYFAEHGTSSLKEGEAFMFAEDTGEASLFLADGTAIRRMIAQPEDSHEVIKQRRPDILNPEDMLYNLSLLGKLIPKMDTSTAATLAERKSAMTTSEDNYSDFGKFKTSSVAATTQSFWGWLKNVLKF